MADQIIEYGIKPYVTEIMVLKLVCLIRHMLVQIDLVDY